MTTQETFTIIQKSSGHHYDTNDQRFYGENWERTMDTKKYLLQLIENDPDKFEGCIIEDNVND